MSRASSNGNPIRLQYQPLVLEDFSATWAGSRPMMPGFCFGSEDGRLLFTDDQGRKTHGPMKGSMSGEAINGVASIGEWLAVSTRAEVTVWSMHPEREKRRGAVVFPHGAHGIVAGSSEFFVAPLGRLGIMLLRAGSSPNDPVGILGSNKPGMYFYRVLTLKGTGGKDLLVTAAREGGVGITETLWGQETYEMRVANFDGLDIVDVCAVTSTPGTQAIAALGRDGTLILVRDALHDENPARIKFNAVQGIGYRVYGIGQHVIVLTSQGLYWLADLAGNLVKGIPPGSFPTRIVPYPMEAVDANLIDDRWLLAVTPEEIWKCDLSVLSRGEPSVNGEVQAAVPSPRFGGWDPHSVIRRSERLEDVLVS